MVEITVQAEDEYGVRLPDQDTLPPSGPPDRSKPLRTNSALLI